MGRFDDRFPPYVSAAERREKNAQHAKSLSKEKTGAQPVILQGKTIAASFWGKAWCANLENYGDYATRLPRGRTYIRNGAVLDLRVEPAKVTALVSGSELYKINISIAPLQEKKWKLLIERCTGHIDSLVELLQGKFSHGVLEFLTDQKEGIFPAPKEMKFSCTCPDHAHMCKHVAAALYGVGARLDQKPELFFVLRNVDQGDLLARAPAMDALPKVHSNIPLIATNQLSDIFGVDIDLGAIAQKPARKKKLKG